VKESGFEDFIHPHGETIFVSTMHKAKGKEFDNVFLLLNSYNPVTDEKKRLLYVAMTRAKNNLEIHLNGNYFDDISYKPTERFTDPVQYSNPKVIVMHLTHKDIFLNHFIYNQHKIKTFKSGDKLQVTDEGCADQYGNCILKFSKQFREQTMRKHQSNGYKIVEASVNFIVYWQKEEQGKEHQIILPALKLERQG
jgi:ATP-dependent DNA helicase RecQ